MRNLLFGLGLVGILAACNAASTDVEVSENENTAQEQIAEVAPNRVLKVDIDGMVCQMGCGGSIRKELNAVEGVGECNFDFKDGRETNVATIEFDKELISADEITKIISTINDNQFTVGESSAIAIGMEDNTSAEAASNSTDEDGAITMSSSTGYQLPNLLEIFSRLLIN